MNKFFKISCIFLLQVQVFAEIPSLTLTKIKEQQLFIKNAASKFNVNPQHLSAIIYTERTLNYDWTDEALDIAIAKAGKNSSMGFCQVKLKTAYFIERQLHNSNSLFYLGKQYKNLLFVSQNVTELIDKLMDKQLNIFYAAAYLKIMQIRWEKAGYPIDKRPDILGTLYSTGLYNNDGTEREPNSNPKANTFGKNVLESMKIINSLNLF